MYHVLSLTILFYYISYISIYPRETEDVETVTQLYCIVRGIEYNKSILSLSYLFYIFNTLHHYV